MNLFKNKKKKSDNDLVWSDKILYKNYEGPEEFEKDFSRFGKFRVDSEILVQEFMTTREIFKDVFVIKTSHDAMTGVITYLGVSKHFEKTPARLMENTPEYKLIIATEEEDGERYYKYRFEKVFNSTKSNAIH